MVANRIWILIGKKVSGEATLQELEELQSLIASSGDSGHTIDELEQTLLTVNIESPHKSDEEIEERWSQFKKKIAPEPEVIPLQRNGKRRFFWLAAASILVLFAITITLVKNNTFKSGLFADNVVKPAESPKKIVLPDGSTVWLNAKSKITLSKKFGVKERGVSLVGEAFFDVVRDAKHPFVVTTASMHLRVLGTRFNVRAFTNEKKSEAALVKGSIEVTLVNNPDKKYILKPSEKITVRNSNLQAATASGALAQNGRIIPIPLIILSNIHYKDQDPLPVEAQWIEKKLAFESETFDDIATRMERFYNVSINFQDESVKSLVLTGVFKDETLNDAMKGLQYASGGQFKYSFERNNQITIYR
ncbi:FecR family protein [Mucilaginibacter calamicampi]|uniref:FecR family protein n=1 Tax=Mucilaginibacter calamicampi TaxID=1302352 RepID=A0ABW2YYW4_9SPHI